MELAPVALFCYARPDHLRHTLEALKQNTLAQETKLYVFCDAPKNERAKAATKEVRKVVKKLDGFRDIVIVKREKNWGLAPSIIDGASRLCEDYGKVIVLEDDLVTSPYFLQFMNDALAFYADQPKVMSVSGYNHPPSLMPIPEDYEHDVYFSYRNTSWGWATWKDRWDSVDWKVEDFGGFLEDSEAQDRFARGGEDLMDMLKDQQRGYISSWSIRFSLAHSRQDRYALYPVCSYIDNIGTDGSGVHYDASTARFKNDLSRAPERSDFPDELELNEELLTRFRAVYDYALKSKLKRAVTEPFKPRPWIQK